MTPQQNTAARTFFSLLFLAAAAVHLAWFTPANAIALVVGVSGIAGGLLAISNIFHVPAKAVSVIQTIVSVLQNVQADIPAETARAAKKIAKAGIALFIAGYVFVRVVACTPAATPIVVSQVPNDVVTDIGCFVADALQGTQSLPQIFAQCGALAADQAAALLAALVQGGGLAVKAGPNVLHVPLVTLSDAQRVRVVELQSQLPGGAQ